MKLFNEQQIDDLLKLKFGKIVTQPGHTAYVSNQILGKIFNVSEKQIRQIYKSRFEKIKISNLPLL